MRWTVPAIVASIAVLGACGGSSGDPGRAGFDAISPVVQDFVDGRGLNGAGLVVVDREDGVVHEEYWGDFGPDRVSFIASSSKMITAGVLVHLADDGLLDLDAPLGDVVPWAVDQPAPTAAQLVSNSSGLVGLLPNPTYPPYLCQFMPFGDLEGCGEQILTTPDDDGDTVPPDTEFRYGGGQWQVAGAVAEAVSGRSWSELIEEIYVEPCGVDSLGYGNHLVATLGFGLGHPTGIAPGEPPTDNPNMEGGAYIAPPDYATLLLMHLRDGACPDGQVLSPAGLHRMHDDRVAAYGDAGDDDTGYGMGWFVDRDTGILTDPGAYGSVPWLDLEAGYGAYLVIEATADDGFDLYQEIDDLVDAAVSGG